MIRLHGTAVLVSQAGVLLRGPSGAGKSDLALRLIDGGALLVADDQVEIHREDDRLLMSPPATIAGLFEVRGVGIVKLAHRSAAPLNLVVDLVAAETIERLPVADNVDLLGCPVPRLALDPWAASAAAKVRLAAQMAAGTVVAVS